MRPAASAVALLVAATLGCGARSTLDHGRDGSAPTTRDGGSRDAGWRDAGTPPIHLDAGSPDAGRPPEPCVLDVRVSPTTIFSDRDGLFNAPQVEMRDGLIDLFATFLPSTDARIPQPYGSRFDLALTPASSPVGSTTPVDAMFTATLSGALGVCFQDFASRFPILSIFAPGGAVRSTALDLSPGACLGVAANEDRWMVAHSFGEGPAAEPVGTVLDRDGGVVTMPTPLAPALPRARVAVTTFRDGFAWIVTGGPDEAIVGALTDGLTAREHRLSGIPATPAGAAIASLADEPGFLAIATWADGLQVIVIDPLRGAEIRRTDALDVGLFTDERPAIVAHEGGLVVASKDYGDGGPTSGELRITSIDTRTRPGSVIDVPIRRIADLPDGLDVAVDGSTFVVHWSDVEVDASGASRSVTRAMVLECLPR